MNNIAKLLAGLSVCTTPLLGKELVKSTTKPNVIIILADDMGYGDLGCYGVKDIKTPNIDKLSTQGVRFTNFYANGPECTPTRASLLSGRYQQRVGGLECAIGGGNVGRYDEAKWLSDKRELGLPSEDCTLPFALKKAGYNTAITGKWHLGYEKKFRPNTHGFDYSIGLLGWGGDYFYQVEPDSTVRESDLTGSHTLAQNGKEIFRNGEYTTKLITREAINWLNQQNKEKPFFLYVPYTAPHDPYQGPNDDKGRPLQGKEWQFKSRAKYIEMVEEMDKGIGQLLSALKEKNLDKETIVIFFSDNGGTKIANNGIFSGYKGNVYEGGIREPCIIRWPEKIPANTVSDQSAISFDLSRSILEQAGVKTGRLKLDGYDIINHIVQKKEDFDRTLFWRLKRANFVRKAVRDGDLKYLAIFKNNSIVEEKLFNLKDDPSEHHDLLTSMPEKAKELREKLSQWEEEVAAPRLKDFKKDKLSSDYMKN